MIMIQRTFIFFSLLFCHSHFLFGQTPWPSENWTAAVNLTGVLDEKGVTELSGLHWNPLFNRLYVAHGDGRLRVLQLHVPSKTFSPIANIAGLGGPEGVTQANYSANEFYTVDEDNYQIKKFTHTADFSSATLSKHWNLLTSPSPMTNTGNTGPEGIAFVPDSFLTAKGFISQVTGSPYTSIKGMGGLIFIAHQDQGFVWAFDIDPNINDSFVFVGKYKTNRSESCDLEFDRSTGLLYILHNTGSNSLEVTDLSTTAFTGGRKFVTKNEYSLPNPSGNTNIEGFALTPRLSSPDGIGVGAFLCRDVESDESTSYQKDCLRWFEPFTENGTSGVRSSFMEGGSNGIAALFPNPAAAHVTYSFTGKENDDASVRMYNSLGQRVLERLQVTGSGGTFDISALPVGFYCVEIIRNRSVTTLKLIKR